MMVDTLEEEPATATVNKEIPAKRRKVRKGTRSCWECKRRKTRCIFASSEDVKCIGCQRRRAPCVSQDMPEDLSPAKKGNQILGERITRVESFMKELIASNNHAGVTSQVEREPGQDRRRSNSDALQTRSSDDSPPSSVRALLTPAESLAESAPSSSFLTPDSQGVSCQAETETTALHHLFAAFPAEEDANILLRESCRPSLYTDLVNTQPHSKLTRETLAAPFPMAELPGPSTHPVILAKRMLMFAITLRSEPGENFIGLSEPPSILMRRLMAAATTWVTTKEEMHGTVESLICIILEGVFEVNCGNLRRAWVVYRRAMTVAQLMGLHRSPMPPLKRIDPELDANPEFLWFRIVYMDRYLSLLLGLPQGTSDKSMGAMSVLRLEPPLGKFERLLTVVASRILERNEISFSTSEITTTQSIDSELLRISKSIPASFWRPANFQGLTPGSPDTLLETVRLAAQVYYYGLLIQLHLPYMMHGIGDKAEHEYSKMTCVNASREIMTRFIAHRSFNPMSSCSRPVDFFALLAAMTLLLAHLDAHHHREITNFLAHQRLSDRAMLNQALERMDVISHVNKDEVTEKSAELIRQLLDIEADAAEGSSYTARSVGGDEDGVQEGIEKKGDALRLHIPYLGVIKIARQGPIYREPLLGNTASSRPHENSQVESFPQRGPTLAALNDAFASLPPHASPRTVEQNQPLSPLQGMAHGSTSSGGLPSVWSLETPGYDGQQPMLQYPSSSQDDITLQLDVGLPAITAGVDDWAFQGVDMAFFDSLMRGTSSGDAAGLE